MALFAESLERFEAVELKGYVVEAPFARGGHSTVHRGRRLADDRSVAIKRWTDPVLRDGGLNRIKREIMALRRMRCESVVRILDARRDHRGQPCLIMEYVAGGTLAERIAKDGPVSPQELPELLAPLFQALERFAELGLIHRDIKPANIVLREADGAPVVVDFSIAKWLDPEDRDSATTDSSALTATNAGIGTLPYMAPEQCAGHSEADLAVDNRTDLYGLGALVFHALTGTPPWGGESAWERLKRNPWVDPWPLDRERRRRVEDARGALSPALRAWCIRSLEGDPGKRHPIIGAMRRDFEAAFGGAPETASKRRPAFAAAVALAVLVGLGLTQGLGRAARDPDETPKSSPGATLEPPSTAGSELAETPGDAAPETTPGDAAPEATPGDPSPKGTRSQDPSPSPTKDPGAEKSAPTSREPWQDRFCVSCGHRHGDTDGFCVRCGTRRN